MNHFLDISNTQPIVYAMDMIGVIACAVAGTLLAKQKQMDIAGCVLVAGVNAIGGGTLRDLLLDRHPLFWMTDLSYLAVVFVVSLLVQVFFYRAHRIKGLLMLFDAIGLAAFTLIGLKVGLASGQSFLVASMMGVITAIVGGLVRDMICNEIPLVLRREVYITAALVGCFGYFALSHLSLPPWLLDLLTLALVFSVRMLAVWRDWHLPNISLPSKNDHTVP